MSNATHPTRIKVLKVVRTYLNAHSIKATTGSKKAFITDANGMPAICPKAIGGGTMTFSRVHFQNMYFRNTFNRDSLRGSQGPRSTTSEVAKYVNDLQKLLGIEYTVRFTQQYRTSSPIIHVETNVS